MLDGLSMCKCNYRCWMDYQCINEITDVGWGMKYLIKTETGENYLVKSAVDLPTTGIDILLNIFHFPSFLSSFPIILQHFPIFFNISHQFSIFFNIFHHFPTFFILGNYCVLYLFNYSSSLHHEFHNERVIK